ncbi:MAG: type II secretion system F family protein [Nocardioidaceae bacterium]
MTSVAGVLAFAAVWLWCEPRCGRTLDRLELRTPEANDGNRPQRSVIEDPVSRTVLAVTACAVLGWIFLGPVAASICAPAGLGLSWWLGTLEPPSVTREREEVARDLPLAVDLLAACAHVGLSVEQSLSQVSRAVGGALARRFDAMTARLQLGADPVAEWSRLGQDGLLAPLGRTMIRSHESGAPVVEGLTRLAIDRRRERRTQTELRARSVGVKAAGPLAACFLPAFMLIGVVPTIAGAFSHLVL